MAKNKVKKKSGMAAALRALIIVALLLVIALSVYSAVSSLMGSGEGSTPGESTRTEQAAEQPGQDTTGGGSQQGSSGGGSPGQAAEPSLDEDGSYTSREDVALYLWTYGKLPGNFITKSAAQKKGWEGGSLEKYAPGKSIGGDRFGNYEGILPKKKGRVYYECDIDTMGARSRGAKRIVFSNDVLIYYTDDHYEHFTLLYGGEG